MERRKIEVYGYKLTYIDLLTLKREVLQGEVTLVR